MPVQEEKPLNTDAQNARIPPPFVKPSLLPRIEIMSIIISSHRLLILSLIGRISRRRDQISTLAKSDMHRKQGHLIGKKRRREKNIQPATTFPPTDGKVVGKITEKMANVFVGRARPQVPTFHPRSPQPPSTRHHGQGKECGRERRMKSKDPNRNRWCHRRFSPI